MAAQCTPDPLSTSLHVSFSEDITTTHLIPVANEDEKAAMHYTRRDLKIFKLTNKLRTQRKIVILMKLIADRNAQDAINTQDALNKRKEENIQAMQFQTTQIFCNAGGSAIPVEERTWKRTCCTETKDCDATPDPVILPETRGAHLPSMVNTNIREENVKAMEFQKTLEEMTWKRTCCTKTKDFGATSAPVLLPEARGFQLDCDLPGMANTNSNEDNVQAMEFQNTLEEMTWKRTCCTKTKDCDATSAPVLLPEARGFQLDCDLLGMANTNPNVDNVQAMEFQKALEEMTWKRTYCRKVKDCDATSAPVMLPKTCGSQLNGDVLGTTNPNPEEEKVQAMEFQKIKSFYIGGPRATQEERTCSDLKLKDCGAKAILAETRGSQLDSELVAVAG
jgi:hypothetical protein